MREPVLARALGNSPPRLGARLRRLFAVSAVLAPLLIFAPMAMGKPKLSKDDIKKEEVKKLFEDGMIQYDLGKFEDAIKTFEKAYAMYPDPAFLYNIGQSNRMAGHIPDAVRSYKTFLRKVPNTPSKGEVTKFIEALEKAPPTQSGPQLMLPPPPAVPYVEPKSKHAYMTRIRVDGMGYMLTGVSRRSYFGFLLYGIGLYVEEDPARQAFPKLVEKAGGKDPSQLRARDLAQNFIVLGEFGKMAVLSFTRDIQANKIRDSYRDMLKDDLKPDAPPVLRQHTEQFLNLFSRDMHSGEELSIQTTTDGHINILFGSDKRVGPIDQTLAIDLWTLWIGQKAINADMKSGLVERISALGEVAGSGPVK
jgi:tetratricopeptide (TPR) repeat protein